MSKSRYIGLRLGLELWREVQGAVAASGETQAAWLRRALTDAVDRQALLHSLNVTLAASERRVVAAVHSDLEAMLSGLEIVEDHAPYSRSQQRKAP